MKFSIKDFFTKCDQICRKLPIWSHLLNIFLMVNFIFCTVSPCIDKKILVHKINFLILFIWFQFRLIRRENLQILHLYLGMKKRRLLEAISFLRSICLTLSYIKSLLKKIPNSFSFLWFDSVLLEFFFNKTTLRKTSFSTSFSSKKIWSSIAKASLKFIAGFKVM